MSPADEQVLTKTGDFLGRLQGGDLRARCQLGREGDGRRERKQSLTGETSSRWAGAITRTSNDQYERGLANLVEQRVRLVHAVERLDRRLGAPVGGHDENGVRGYASQAERFQKQRRRQKLKARLAEVEKRIAEGRVSVVRGGRSLLKARQKLEAAGLSEEEWRARYERGRLFLTADGEKDKRLGNETIRVDPESGVLELRLPSALAELANRPLMRYRLAHPVRFRNRVEEWREQVEDGAVRYDIACDEKGRWFLAASWTSRQPVRLPELGQATERGVIGIDLNADHLACWRLDGAGNPIGSPHTVPLELKGRSSVERDGRIRAAVSEVMGLAEGAGLGALAIEDLHFSDTASREQGKHRRGRSGRHFRALLSGFPTSRFRDRLVGMCARRGIVVIAVDPAYSSKWAAEHWQQPLAAQTGTGTVTRHQAAAVVIGRRGCGHGARRRPGVPGRDQRIATGELPARAGGQAARPREPVSREAARAGPASASGARRATRSVTTVRTDREQSVSLLSPT